MANNNWGIDPEVFASLDHGNRHAAVIAPAVILVTLATSAVLLRLYVRHWLIHQIWLDDYLATTGLLGTIALGISQVVQTKGGLGSHIWDFRDGEQVILYFKSFYAINIAYNTTLLLIKLSLFFQYYRLVKDINRYRWTYLGIMGFVTIWSLVQIFLYTFPCNPIPRYWDGSIPGNCLDLTKLLWVNSVGNIVTEVIVLLLPMPVVWQLNLRKGQKLAIIGVFCLGFLTCLISIARLISVAYLRDDLPYESAPVASLGQAEVTSGLLCSALLTLRPLLRWFSGFRTTQAGASFPLPRYAAKKSKPSSSSRRTENQSGRSNTSAAELTLRDGFEAEPRMPRKEPVSTNSQRSMHSRTLTGENGEDPTARAMNQFLGLQPSVQTVISSWDKDSQTSESPTSPRELAPSGIMVKQVWSIRNKESDEEFGGLSSASTSTRRKMTRE